VSYTTWWVVKDYTIGTLQPFWNIFYCISLHTGFCLGGGVKLKSNSDSCPRNVFEQYVQQQFPIKTRRSSPVNYRVCIHLDLQLWLVYDWKPEYSEFKTGPMWSYLCVVEFFTFCSHIISVFGKPYSRASTQSDHGFLGACKHFSSHSAMWPISGILQYRALGIAFACPVLTSFLWVTSTKLSLINLLILIVSVVTRTWPMHLFHHHLWATQTV